MATIAMIGFSWSRTESGTRQHGWHAYDVSESRAGRGTMAMIALSWRRAVSRTRQQRCHGYDSVWVEAERRVGHGNTDTMVMIASKWKRGSDEDEATQPPKQCVCGSRTVRPDAFQSPQYFCFYEKYYYLVSQKILEIPFSIVQFLWILARNIKLWTCKLAGMRLDESLR